MQKSTILLVLVFGTLVSFGQNISVTFTGTGAATRIDSVTATNLITNQSITLPGNETLVLGTNTGITSISELTNLGMVYPNPFSGKATFTTIVENPQTVYLKVQNLFGQLVAQTRAFIPPGENEFVLSVNTAGIYMVSLTTDKGTASYKVICTETTQAENRIQYLGSVFNNHNNHTNQNNQNNFSLTGLKTSQTSYILDYLSGDIILYKSFSGIYSTIVTDSPVSSKNYEVKFAACTDPDGKNYSIVEIGDQTWTAENLAFLPTVSPSSSESQDSPLYYVYDYDGNSVSEAKTTTNYLTYGVLYNWTAAMNGAPINWVDPIGVQGICPNGWHIPSDAEWTDLTDYLGTSTGGKMKETGTDHWSSPNEGATNASGFTALPGGFRNLGSFYYLGEYALFLSSSASGLGLSWNRNLNYGNDEVHRSNNNHQSGYAARCILGQGAPGLALLTTKEVTAITDTTAASGGNIISNWGTAVTARGVCWNTIEKPTISNSKTNDGSGPGTFISTLTGLRLGTMYYVRAYATNSVGTTYGDEKQFKTTGMDDENSFEYDGRIYNFKTIGTQTWMTENLAYLPAVSPSSAGSDGAPAYYVYGYEGTAVDAAKATANYTTYGVLYNWSAALTACPTGWHLPEDSEWKILEKFLGMSQSDADAESFRFSGSVGKRLKSTSGWLSQGNGDNSSGFNAFPGGYRLYSGTFDFLGQMTTFWSSSVDVNGVYGWYRTLSAGHDGVVRNYFAKNNGVSVRCVRD